MADLKPDRDWRKEAAKASAEPERGSKGATLFVAGGLALALITVIVYLALSVKTAPPARLMYLAFAGNPRWPVVPFARADYDRLIPLFKVPEHSGYKPSDFIGGSEEATRYEATLRALKEAVPDQPLLLYVKGLTVAREGEVYLITANASPAKKDEDWHPARELIAAFADSPAKNRLLVLDVAYPIAAPLSGVFSDRAAAALHTTIESMKGDLKGGWVMITAGPGEFAQAIDDEASGAVACYLDRGLRGQADANGDAKLRLRELADYVARRTKVWAQFGLGVSQQPYLVGSGDDFQIVVEARSAPAEHSIPRTFPLKALWERRDQWEAAGPAQWPGACLRRALSLGLMRAGERLDAGEPPDAVRKDTEGKTSPLVADWDDKIKPLRLPPLTWLGRGKSADDIAKVKSAVADWLSPRTRAEEKLKQKLPADNPAMAKDDQLILAAIWEQLAKQEMTFDDMVRLLGPEALPPAEARKPFAESLLIAELAYLTTASGGGGEPLFKKRRRDSWPQEGIVEAVRAEQRYRQALAELMPETYHWFKDDLAKASAKLLAAERDLLRTADLTYGSPIDAAKAAAVEYREAWKVCRDVAEKGAAVRAALGVLDRAYVELPGYAQLLARLDRKLRGEPLQHWREAVAASDRLASAFAAEQVPGPDALAAADMVNNRLRSLADWLEGQVTPWRRDYPSLAPPKKTDDESTPEPVKPPRDLRDPVPVKLLADCPRLKAADRAICWEWSRRLNGQAWQTLSEDRADPNTAKAALHPHAFDVRALGLVVEEEADRAEARAQIGVDLLRLAGRLTPGIEQQLRELSAGQHKDLEAWDKLAVDIYHAAYPPRREQASGGDTLANDAQAARASLILGDSAAGARYAGRQREAYCNWLHDYIQQEAKGRKLLLADVAHGALIGEFTDYYNNLALEARQAEDIHRPLVSVRDP